MQIYEIIENIKKLPEDELKILLEWIENFEQDFWDKEFERDVKMGKLDKLAEQAIEDFRAGKCRKL
ncbi:MAG: hypothetical protein DRG40_01385 [Deltaproteobacteria bacterium]|nr:MAG: hypothetical protein DRG40_01385 [Deltaproteobacteria bacterium]